MPTCFVTGNGSQHHVTGVYGVNEVGREGTPLAHPLNGVVVILVYKNDAL